MFATHSLPSTKVVTKGFYSLNIAQHLHVTSATLLEARTSVRSRPFQYGTQIIVTATLPTWLTNCYRVNILFLGCSMPFGLASYYWGPWEHSWFRGFFSFSLPLVRKSKDFLEAAYASYQSCQILGNSEIFSGVVVGVEDFSLTSSQFVQIRSLVTNYEEGPSRSNTSRKTKWTE